jgi:ATP-dependent RNA helicase DeaD
MTLPSRKDITNRRTDQFKELISNAMESQDLEFFEELIDNYQSENDVGLRRVAATLAYLLQKERPLQPEESVIEESKEKDSGAPRATRAQRDTTNLVRYRIEVGRMHGVEPGNIVGAISNEANLTNRDIGQIKLFDSFSLVDLPKDLPVAVFRHLQTVWVCGQQLKIAPDKGTGDVRQDSSVKRTPFKPGAKKAPFGKGGPKGH